jgi:hypothetical protein
MLNATRLGYLESPLVEGLQEIFHDMGFERPKRNRQRLWLGFRTAAVSAVAATGSRVSLAFG